MRQVFQQKSYLCSPFNSVWSGMKVIVDNKIPYISEAIEKIADEVVYMPGGAIGRDVVRDADALIVRTRTRCDKDLLEGSKVKFIGTATIGFDHIDTDYCHESGIAWCNCPGCNAGAVAQYVESALLLLEQERGLCLRNSCLGIVGVGHVGSHVLSVAGRLGMRVLLNDPPRYDRGGHGFTGLQTLAEECDIITFHTPLYRSGRYCTYHLGDETFFRSLRKKPVIINTSRGEVLDTGSLIRAIDTGVVPAAVIDVWENEPNISLDLLNRVYIGTPHIAGYSADGKANATRMTLDALCRFFGKQVQYTIELPHQPYVPYDPRTDCVALRNNPSQFEQLRGDYPLRREK